MILYLLIEPQRKTWNTKELSTSIITLEHTVERQIVDDWIGDIGVTYIGERLVISLADGISPAFVNGSIFKYSVLLKSPILINTHLLVRHLASLIPF